MTVETATYISDLNSSYPAAGDAKSEGDDHLRLLKSTVKATFPNVSGAVTPTHTELNYVDGVTSAIQTQIDAKAPTASPTFTGTVVLPSTTSIGNVSATELGYLDGVTSAIQTQINALGAPGSMAYLSTVTASNSATMDIETTFDSTYDAYVIVVSGLVPASTAVLNATLKVGGAYASANYNYHVARLSSSSGAYASSVGASASAIALTGASTPASTGLADFVIWVFNPSSTSLAKVISFDGISTNGSADVSRYTGAGLNTATSALTGVRLAMASGNITSGKARLYGIRNS